MRTSHSIGFIMTFAFLTSLLALVTLGSDGAGKPAVSRAELTEQACEDLKREAAALEAMLAKAKTAIAIHAVVLAHLEDSQEAWARYREAQLVLHDPDKMYGVGSSGSVMPMCLCSAAASITRARVEELQRYIELPEGDVCRVPHG
jgi:uncharacterized protein YecT (DUF1311 family)